jgi:hypothetical protein
MTGWRFKAVKRRPARSTQGFCVRLPRWCRPRHGR